MCEALRAKPKQINTKLGTFGEVAYALAPKAVDQILHLAYRVFPESTAAKGGKGGEGRGRQGLRRGDALAHLMKGSLVVPPSDGLEARSPPGPGWRATHCAPRRELLGAVAGTIPDIPGRRAPAAAPVGQPARRLRYAYDGEDVAFSRARGALPRAARLPLHGLRAAAPAGRCSSSASAGSSPARELAGLPQFPFAHRVEVAAELTDTTLTLTTTVTATGDAPGADRLRPSPVPAAPGVPRAQWELTLPVADRLLLDERLVPTGEREPAGDLDGPLGERTFDDGFTLDERRGPFVLAGGGRRIEVAFEPGYRYAQIFAPGDRGRHLLRADDRAGGRVAPLAGRRRARRVVHGALQRVGVAYTLSDG